MRSNMYRARTKGVDKGAVVAARAGEGPPPEECVVQDAALLDAL